MKNLVVILALAAVMCYGCSTPEGKGAVIGGAAGSVLGGVIGHQSGHGVEGAAIGAAVGAVSGAVIGGKTAKNFCPVCGRHFDQSVKFCPYDGSELKSKQE